MLIEEKEEFSFQQKVIWAVGVMAFRRDGGNEPKSRGVRLFSFFKWNYHELEELFSLEDLV